MITILIAKKLTRSRKAREDKATEQDILTMLRTIKPSYVHLRTKLYAELDAVRERMEVTN
jgi:hypothetical protein